MLLGFKRRFAPYVLDGTKTHTIRATRKIRPKVGEICHCYVDPRQRTMKLLGRWPCVAVQKISIQKAVHPARLLIRIDGELLSNDEAEALLYRDGFRDKSGETFEAMAQAREFWELRLPFGGDIIHWEWSRQ